MSGHHLTHCFSAVAELLDHCCNHCVVNRFSQFLKCSFTLAIFSTCRARKRDFPFWTRCSRWNNFRSRQQKDHAIQLTRVSVSARKLSVDAFCTLKQEDSLIAIHSVCKGDINATGYLSSTGNYCSLALLKRSCRQTLSNVGPTNRCVWTGLRGKMWKLQFIEVLIAVSVYIASKT